MKVLKYLSIFALASSTLHASVPENDLSFPIKKSRKKSLSTTEISEMRFHQIANRFKDTWGPIIKKKFKKELKIELLWDSSRVNAHATRDDDDNPIIKMHGGMARHPEMNDDGLLFVLCHELGHYMGGAPKKFRGRSEKRDWASAEGQADYFAAHKCLPRIYEQSYETKILDEYYSQKDVNSAFSHCRTESCGRVVLAGLTIGRVFASMKTSWGDPKIESKSNRKVGETKYKHPDPQCRLDTIMSATHCDKDENYDDKDAKVGACYTKEDLNEPGVRPRCWFHPLYY